MWYLIAIAFVLLVVYLFLHRGQRNLKLPPGPAGYPLIGNVLDITNVELLHRDLVKFRKQHGDIVYFKMLDKSFISLSSPEVIREAFTSIHNATIYADRPPSFLSKMIANNSDVAFVNYKETSGRRKVMHKLLHQYGEGIKALENVVSTESERFIKEIEDFDSNPFDPTESVFKSLSNVMCLLITGRTFDSNHAACRYLRIFQNELNYLLSGGIDTLLGYLPFLIHLPLRFRKHLDTCLHAKGILKQIYFTEQKATFDPEHTRGIIDNMLKHQLEPTRAEKDTLTDSNIFEMTLNIFGGGIMTTQGTLMGLLLIFLHYPDVQRKLQNECDKILIEGRLPSLPDRKSMPYTQATITEAFRFLTVLPVSLPHFCSPATTLMGYDIPEKTTVLSNLWGIHHDERIWERPFEFEPQRFLDRNGEFLPPEDPTIQRVLVFGIGKRACPGEVFARTRLFLYLTSLMSSFTFLPEDEQNIPSCDPRDTIPGVVTTYPSFKIRAIPRNKARTI